MVEPLESLVKVLRSRRQTVSFAESCTGGRLSCEVTQKEGVSDVYMGSVVAYCNTMKVASLGVSWPLLRSVGAVSRPVALSMAHGVKTLTKSSWAVSITGIAGPGGGTERKPVGTVCFAVVGPGFEKTIQKHFDGHRVDIQKASTEFAITWLLESL